MNELIKVNYTESEQPTVSGRELHEALEVKTEYKKWFERMSEYGFTENVDFIKVTQKCPTSSTGQSMTDHQLSIDMAKEICMIQRSEKGKRFRQYFIDVENKWNTPEAVMARALQLANKKLDEIKNANKKLETTVAVQTQQIAELQPKASYYDVVLNCKDLISTTEIAKDYGKSAVWLNAHLHERKVQFKQGGIWLLYAKYAEKGYTNTKTQTYNGNDGNPHTKVHTYWTQKGRLFIYDLLKSEGITPLIEQ
jgi:anti-repressor protein